MTSQLVRMLIRGFKTVFYTSRCIVLTDGQVFCHHFVWLCSARPLIFTSSVKNGSWTRFNQKHQQILKVSNDISPGGEARLSFIHFSIFFFFCKVEQTVWTKVCRIINQRIPVFYCQWISGPEGKATVDAKVQTQSHNHTHAETFRKPSQDNGTSRPHYRTSPSLLQLSLRLSNCIWAKCLNQSELIRQTNCILVGKLDPHFCGAFIISAFVCLSYFIIYFFFGGGCSSVAWCCRRHPTSRDKSSPLCGGEYFVLPHQYSLSA